MRGKRKWQRGPEKKSKAEINRMTNPGYYRRIKSLSRYTFSCSIRRQRLSRLLSPCPVFLFSHSFNHLLSLSHPSNGIREVEVFYRRSNVVRKDCAEQYTHLYTQTRVLSRWSVGLIDVSVSDNLMEGRDNWKSHWFPMWQVCIRVCVCLWVCIDMWWCGCTDCYIACTMFVYSPAVTTQFRPFHIRVRAKVRICVTTSLSCVSLYLQLQEDACLTLALTLFT